MTASSSPLRDFVTRLQTDPDLQTQFNADPTGTMTEAGLSADDQDIVRSRDLDRLNTAIAQQTGDTSPNLPTIAWGISAADSESDPGA